jgi:hypothetical protein
MLQQFYQLNPALPLGLLLVKNWSKKRFPEKPWSSLLTLGRLSLWKMDSNYSNLFLGSPAGFSRKESKKILSFLNQHFYIAKIISQKGVSPIYIL